MSEKRQRPLGRRQKAELDTIIGFYEGLLRRDPQEHDVLELLAESYVQRGRVDDGLRIDHRLAEMRPNDPQVRYNLACSLALNGRLDEAAAELERALDCGYEDFQWLDEDPHLDPLRSEPSFRKLRAKIRQLRGKTPDTKDCQG